MSWKTSFAAAVAAIVLGSAASAQSPRFMVHIGPTYAWRDSNQPDREGDGQVSFGGGAGFRLGEGRFALQGGVLITGKSTAARTEGPETRLKIEYIELPVLAYMALPGTEKLRPYAIVGPVLSLEMRCRTEYISGNSRDEVGCDTASTTTYDRNKVDLSAAAGIGVSYVLSGGRHIGLETRYTHGFRNISDDDENPTFEIRNRAAAVFVSYSFPLNADL